MELERARLPPAALVDGREQLRQRQAWRGPEREAEPETERQREAQREVWRQGDREREKLSHRQRQRDLESARGRDRERAQRWRQRDSDRERG